MDKILLGNRIKKARKDAKMTGERLSELCNINASYLRQIECGSKMPSLPLFIQLCTMLKVSPSYLLADVLPNSENQDIDALWERCKNASPKQIKVILSVLNAYSE